MKYIAFVLLVSWISVFADEAVSPSVSPAANDVEEVLVVGEQPGPSLWKVSKGDHVLWILGTLSPLPKNMQWRSAQVNSLFADSQEFIKPPEIKLHVGFWGKVGLLPSLIGIKNNPDGKKLQNVLPEDLYSRWSVLKDKYIGQNPDVEKYRPIFAATELFKKSIEKSDMVPNSSVRWTLEGIVRAHNIKTTIPVVAHELTSPRETVKKFKKSTLDDTACFARTIERLETDLDAMRVRANAWATGDMDLLRKLPYHDEQEDCESAVLNSSVVQDQGLDDAKAQLQAAWVAAVESALTNNQSSFAMLSMSELYNPTGYLVALEKKGYSVERPE